jgi:hypothetical protein
MGIPDACQRYTHHAETRHMQSGGGGGGSGKDKEKETKRVEVKE